MKLNDYRGKAVLVTGGTKGLGLAAGLAFGREGAQVFLTHKWSSADEAQVKERFAAIDAPTPVIVEADASQPKEAEKVLDAVAKTHDGVDVFVSNVCAVTRGEGLDKYSERALLKSLDYSAWPFVEYLHRIGKRFTRYPAYAVATSSDGRERGYPGYDYVGVSKAVLETFCRYMAIHLKDEGTKINVLRTRQVLTDSYRDMFGAQGEKIAKAFPEFTVAAEEVGDTILALCSGLMDAMSGEIVTLDHGAGFADNIANLGPRMEPTDGPA